MPSLVEMDTGVAFGAQLADAGSDPVVLVNVFHILPEEVDGFAERWVSSARMLKEKPGFVSTRLHRGIAGSNTFLNYAVWRTAADYAAALRDPVIQAELRPLPGGGTASPHLFRTIEFPGL